MTSARLRIAGCSLTAVVSVFLFVVLFTQPATANRGYSSDLVYFTSDAHTVAVGEGYIDCNWKLTLLWGRKTSYYTSENVLCGGGGTDWYSCATGTGVPKCPSNYWTCMNGLCMPNQCGLNYSCPNGYWCGAGGICARCPSDVPPGSCVP